MAGWQYDISISIEIGHPSYNSTCVLLLSVFHDKGEEGAAQGGSPWQDLCPAYRDFAARDCQLASHGYQLLKILNFVRVLLRIWTASRMRPHASTANQAQPSADSVCLKLWRLTAPKSQRVWMQGLRSTPNIIICHIIHWFRVNVQETYSLLTFRCLTLAGGSNLRSKSRACNDRADAVDSSMRFNEVSRHEGASCAFCFPFTCDGWM